MATADKFWEQRSTRLPLLILSKYSSHLYVTLWIETTGERTLTPVGVDNQALGRMQSLNVISLITGRTQTRKQIHKHMTAFRPQSSTACPTYQKLQE
jgi:hypothetical protein